MRAVTGPPVRFYRIRPGGPGPFFRRLPGDGRIDADSAESTAASQLGRVGGHARLGSQFDQAEPELGGELLDRAGLQATRVVPPVHLQQPGAAVGEDAQRRPVCQLQRSQGRVRRHTEVGKDDVGGLMEDPGRGGERFADVGEHAVGVDLAVGGAAKPDRRNGRESADGDDSDADGPGDRPAEGGEEHPLQPAPERRDRAVQLGGQHGGQRHRHADQIFWAGPSGNFVVDHPHFVGRIGQQGETMTPTVQPMSQFWEISPKTVTAMSISARNYRRRLPLPITEGSGYRERVPRTDENGRQLKALLEYLLDGDVDAKEIYDALGISSSTYYRRIKDADYPNAEELRLLAGRFGLSYPDLQVRFGPMSRQDVWNYVESTPFTVATINSAPSSPPADQTIRITAATGCSPL